MIRRSVEIIEHMGQWIRADMYVLDAVASPGMDGYFSILGGKNHQVIQLIKEI